VHETNRYPRPFGKYLLLRQLAIGGMAEVYLARQSGPAGFEKECVIKRILPSLAADQQFVNMFLDEARIAARLSHPNIVQIFDLGTIDHEGGGDYFLAMEHVHGVDLQQIEEAELARGGRIPLPIAVRICSNVAEGLEHAHRATDGRGQPLGLVHRDVTPSNVIVSFDGVAKILDFGIAKAVAKRGRTEVGVIKGKIPYMSPEQVQGEVLDARSDIFSLGTVLYELTTGRKPFEGSNAASLSAKIMGEIPPSPALLIDNFPASLAAVIERALAKRSVDRWGSARELHEALEDFLLQSGIRCSSHDVAAYLDGLFPGVREAARAAASESLPVEVTDPTMPMHLGAHAGSDPGRRQENPALSMGEVPLATAGNLEEVRRMGGGGRGSGSTVVVVLLIVAVAAIFYLATSHSGDGKPNTTPSPATATPAATQTTVTTPAKPIEKPNTKIEAKRPSELPAPTVSDTPKPSDTPQPEATKPAAEAAKPADAPKPVAEKKVDHPKPHAKPHHEPKPVALPHLPSPPPPDDNP
jgi:eukaryotic-like serine/threonine-protein kinase